MEMLQRKREYKQNKIIDVVMPDGEVFEGKILRRLNFGHYYLVQMPAFLISMIVGHEQFCEEDHVHLTLTQMKWLLNQAPPLMYH